MTTSTDGPREAGAFFFYREPCKACFAKGSGKTKRRQPSVAVVFDAPPSGIAEGNPSLSADKLKRLQVVGFEGVFLFEIFPAIYSSLH